MKCDAALEAGVAAGGAAASAIKRNLHQTFLEEVAREHLPRRIIGLFARLADAGHKPLRQHADHRRCDRVGFDADFHQTRNGLRRGVGVQRGEHNVTGERGFRGDLGGFQIPDFTDENDVGILPHQRAENRGEFQVDVGVDLTLRDPGHDNFNGILDRRNVDARFVDFRQRGVEGGGLAGAGRPGDKNDAVGILHEPLQRLQNRLRDHHLFKGPRRLLAGGRQNPDHGLFTVGRGNRGDAEVGALTADR